MKTVASSPRASIPHLENLKDQVFIDLLMMPWINSKFSLKVDGCSGRFGVDSLGTRFFETGRSGPITQSGDFVKHAISNNFSEDRVRRASHYDDLTRLILESNLTRVLPRNTKVICEVLYQPMGEDLGNSVRFVTIPYDKTYLGNPVTIVPYSVVCANTGANHDDMYRILFELSKLELEDIKVVSPIILRKSMCDCTKYAQDLLGILPENWKEVLSSRKFIHRDEKAQIKEGLLEIKKELAADLLRIFLDKPTELGYTNEGLVCEVNGILFKVITDEYKSLRKYSVYN